MNFEVSEKVRRLQKTIRQFVRDDLEPISQKVEEEDCIPEEIVRKMCEMGLFGLCIPKDYGGLGLNNLEECIVYEELTQTNACFRARIAMSNGAGSGGILQDGTEEQKGKYLPRIAEGKLTPCFALNEPGTDSDISSLKTTAERDKHCFIINGLKHFVWDGDIADLATVIAITNKQNKNKGGVTAFLVEKGASGFYAGRIERKMGLRGSHTSELIFDNCRVPMENVIGGKEMIGNGFKTAVRIIEKGRLILGACVVGAAQKLLDLCVTHARECIQFEKPIGKFQFIQSMLADMVTEIYAGREMLYHAAWLRDRSKKISKEAAMVKLFCSEMGCRIANNAMQIFGDIGYLKDFPVERFYRDLCFYTVYGGTSETQRLVISRELLKG